MSREIISTNLCVNEDPGRALYTLTLELIGLCNDHVQKDPDILDNGSSGGTKRLCRTTRRGSGWP